jgi:hypothetical protein
MNNVKVSFLIARWYMNNMQPVRKMTPLNELSLLELLLEMENK